MNGWHFYLALFMFIFYHKEKVTSIKQNKKSDHFLFDEDLLVFENVPSRKKRTDASNVFELGSGSHEGITRDDLTAEIITSKSWTIVNLLTLFPESSTFSQKRNSIEPSSYFSHVESATIDLLKKISRADKVTCDWSIDVSSKPIEYSLNVYLTWHKALKNLNDIQVFGNLFVAGKNILNMSLPPGFRLNVDSQSFNIMPINDMTSATVTQAPINNYIVENSTFPTESLLFDESTIKNVITTFLAESGSSSMMTFTQPITQSKLTKDNVIASGTKTFEAKELSSITKSEFSSTSSPTINLVGTQVIIDNVVVIHASLRNFKLNSTDIEPNLMFANVTLLVCNSLKELSSADNATGYWTIEISSVGKSYTLHVKLSFTNVIKNVNDMQSVLKTYQENCSNVKKAVTDIGYQAEIAPSNMKIKVANNDATLLQSPPVENDFTGLVLVIFLPLLGVLIISLLACSICYCWFKTRKRHELNRDVIVSTDSNMPKTSSALSNQPKTLAPSMFIKQKTGGKTINQIANESLGEEGSETGTHSQYRANYPIEFSHHALEDNFFKSLENNVRSSQKQTIVRPQSIFTDSTFSMPTNYYDQTTPYTSFQNSKFKRYQIENDDNEKDLIKFDDNEDDEDDAACGISKYDEFDDDFGSPGEFIEAFNPNVQIPRPKIQINRLSIFDGKTGLEANGSDSKQTVTEDKN